jgi:hypothetical protein
METEQNVALLRSGVVIVGRDEGRLTVAGVGESRVFEVTARVLGDSIGVDLIGGTAREIRPRRCLAYREREPRRLQLRIAITGEEHVDDIVVAEDDETVAVYATVCTAIDGEEGETGDVPHHVWLERPLGDRVVIDGTVGRRLQLRRAPRRE